MWFHPALSLFFIMAADDRYRAGLNCGSSIRKPGGSVPELALAVDPAALGRSGGRDPAGVPSAGFEQGEDVTPGNRHWACYEF